MGFTAEREKTGSQLENTVHTPKKNADGPSKGRNAKGKGNRVGHELQVPKNELFGWRGMYG